MRVISGSLGGRRFYPPAGNWPTRPTTDIAKEGLYNILQNRLDFPSSVFLDLFGGTGSHCYEFISRGCKNAVYVDRYRPAVEFVTSTAREWGIEEYLTIYRDDAFRFLKNVNRPFTAIFAGPPYSLRRLGDIPDIVVNDGILTPGGLFILEHNDSHDFQSHPFFDEERNYGDTHFSFFTKNVQ